MRGNTGGIWNHEAYGMRGGIWLRYSDHPAVKINTIKIRIRLRIGSRSGSDQDPKGSGLRRRMNDLRGRHLSKDDNVLLWLSRHLGIELKTTEQNRIKNSPNTIWTPGEQKKPGQPARGSGEKTFSKSSSNVQRCQIFAAYSVTKSSLSTGDQETRSTEWEEKAGATLSSFWTETCKIGGCPVLKGSKLIMSAVVGRS